MYIYSSDEDFADAEVLLFDIAGRGIGIEQRNYHFGYKVLNVRGLSAGVYVVVIRKGKKRVVRKILKIK
ncbi:MAG TPA: T9SS type A sorting domain-containing protein [Phaeodactylibacter sp.]|nr:T9SS type A sorting domain-containing protein [Phaeodactylibacter sp.]